MTRASERWTAGSVAAEATSCSPVEMITRLATDAGLEGN
jgi:hypothetical protein